MNVRCLILYVGKHRTIFYAVSEFLLLTEVVTLIVLVLTPLNLSELWIRQCSGRTVPPHPKDSDCISTWIVCIAAQCVWLPQTVAARLDK